MNGPMRVFVTNELLALARSRGWKYERAKPAGFPAETLFWTSSGETVIFRDRKRALVRHGQFETERVPVPTKPEPSLPDEASPEPTPMTVGDLRNLLAPLAADLPLAAAGLSDETLGALAQLFAMAPAPKRAFASQRQISRGLWQANSAEALGL